MRKLLSLKVDIIIISYCYNKSYNNFKPSDASAKRRT